jgi:putative peptidoglycan lipid II flippase
MMAAALYAIQMPLHGWWSADITRRGIGLALLVGGGLAVYGAVIVLSGAAKVGDITGLLKRERSSTLTSAEGRADNPIPPETLSSST